MLTARRGQAIQSLTSVVGMKRNAAERTTGAARLGVGQGFTAARAIRPAAAPSYAVRPGFIDNPENDRSPDVEKPILRRIPRPELGQPEMWPDADSAFLAARSCPR